ncbi:MAG: cobalamin B12-binding domain-containing protein [Acidobacteriaceae bacterium]|nr:cobalamin B12-binding domain-containing protein [Acidobacteriaceae bacterium]
MYELIAEIGEKTVSSATGTSLRVVCLAVRDEADEIASAMLAQVLEAAGYFVISLPHTTNPGEVLNQIGGEQTDVVLLSAVPPFALSAARHIVKLLHARRPSMKIITGLWNDAANESRLKSRIGSTETDFVVTSFSAALECMNGLVDKMQINDGNSAGWKASTRPDPRGAEATR